MNREDYPVMMKAKDVAEVLNVQAETVVKWCHEGKIENVKVGGLFFIPRDTFFDMLGL